jgi:nucleotide-binding universal stress UspA family protein
MYTRLLIPLDGSTTAEKVLPYARFLARRLRLPLEILEVIEVADVVSHIRRGRDLKAILEKFDQSRRDYLRRVAGTFVDTAVNCTVIKATPAEAIIDKAAEDKTTLISMATHGRSGVKRWLLGSVAEKVLRGGSNPLLLIRATEEAEGEGEANLASIIVPLDGSAVAEQVLPDAAALAKQLHVDLVLFRAYTIPYTALPVDAGIAYAVADEELLSSLRDEATAYLAKKAAELNQSGLERVSTIAQYGLAADEIISMARKTPDNLIAMCTHGRSGVKRWALGSVAETVVRHSGNPVLVVRAS